MVAPDGVIVVPSGTVYDAVIPDISPVYIVPVVHVPSEDVISDRFKVPVTVPVRGVVVV